MSKALYYYTKLIKTGQFNNNKSIKQLNNLILLTLLNTDFTYKMILKKKNIFFINIKMENSTTIIRAEIGFLLKEFRKLIKIYNDKVKNYLKNKHNFQNTEEIISDEDTNTFCTITLEYFKLAKEFRNFVLKYNVSHEYISESILNDIIKSPTEYILHRRQSDYDTDSDESESEDEEISEENSIDNT